MGKLRLLIVLVAPSAGSFGIVPLNLPAFFLRCLPVVVSVGRGDPGLNGHGNNVQLCSQLEKLGRSTFLLSLLLLQVERATATSSPPPPSEVPNFPSHPPFSLAGNVARPLTPTGRPDFPPTSPSTNFEPEGSDVATGTWNSSAVAEPDGLELSSNFSDIASSGGVFSGTSDEPDIDVNGSNDSNWTTVDSPRAPDESSSSGNTSDSTAVDSGFNSTSADTPSNNANSSDTLDSSTQTSENSRSSYTPAYNSSSSSYTSDSSANFTQAPENSMSADTPPNNSSSSSDASDSSTLTLDNSTSTVTPPYNSSSSSDTSDSSPDSTPAPENSTPALTPPNTSSSSSDASDSSTQTSDNSTSTVTPRNNSSSSSDISDSSPDSTQAPENSTSAYTPSSTPPNNSSSSPDTAGSSAQAPANSTAAYTPPNSSSSSSDASNSSTQTSDNSTSAVTPRNNSSSSPDTAGSSAQAPANSTSAYTPPNNSSSSDTSGSSTQTSENCTSGYTPPSNSSSSSGTSVSSTQASENTTCGYTPPDKSSSSTNASNSSTDNPGNCSNVTTPTGTGDMNCTDSSANSTSNSTTAGTNSMYEFELLDYGAVGDGETNDTEAFADAWRDACALNEDYVYILAPSSYTFLLYPITFVGPCFPHIILKVDGIIIAPSNPAIWSNSLVANHWLKFSEVSVTIQGSGTFDGQGQTWWKNSCKTNSKYPCISGPMALGFFTCTNVTVEDISIINAQQMHLVFHKSSLIGVNSITISAPANSPNTDGIHLQITTNVTIENCFIGTGDDCISIQTGSANVVVKNTSCGPGHGISVGGLGKAHTSAYVTNITVQDIIFTNTTNGVRIKSWQGSSGKVENFTYQNLQMNNVANPILINQYYCDAASSGSCPNFTANVAVSRIIYKNITGTSATKKAIMFACSQTVACTNITLHDVDLIQTSGSPVTSFCTNAFGFSDNAVIPGSCLQ